MAVLHHTGFVVRDREAAITFYHHVLGFEVVREYERIGSGIDSVVGYRNTHLRSALLKLEGHHLLELIEYVQPKAMDNRNDHRNRVGAAHLAIEVDDIQLAFDSIVDAGVTTIHPPADLGSGTLACYFRDPDGNWLEFVQISS